MICTDFYSSGLNRCGVVNGAQYCPSIGKYYVCVSAVNKLEKSKHAWIEWCFKTLNDVHRCTPNLGIYSSKHILWKWNKQLCMVRLSKCASKNKSNVKQRVLHRWSNQWLVVTVYVTHTMCKPFWNGFQIQSIVKNVKNWYRFSSLKIYLFHWIDATSCLMCSRNQGWSTVLLLFISIFF